MNRTDLAKLLNDLPDEMVLSAVRSEKKVKHYYSYLIPAAACIIVLIAAAVYPIQHTSRKAPLHEQSLSADSFIQEVTAEISETATETQPVTENTSEMHTTSAFLTSGSITTCLTNSETVTAPKVSENSSTEPTGTVTGTSSTATEPILNSGTEAKSVDFAGTVTFYRAGKTQQLSEQTSEEAIEWYRDLGIITVTECDASEITTYADNYIMLHIIYSQPQTLLLYRADMQQLSYPDITELVIMERSDGRHFLMWKGLALSFCSAECISPDIQLYQPDL